MKSADAFARRAGAAEGLGMSRRFLVVFCGLLLAVNAFSFDIMLPAFFAMERSLGVPIEQVQAVIPVFLFCSALGQLVFGPASDRFGRRPVILLGVVIYICGAIVAAIAGSLEVVLAGRALQGFGSACGAVVARAVMRDVHGGPELARTMALASSIIALGPIVAPLVGFGLVSVGGWRGVFGGMAVYGGVIVLLAAIVLQETHTTPDPLAIRPARLAGALGRVFSNRQSRYFLLLSGINSFAILSFVANAPRLYKSAFGIEGFAFTLLFALTGVGIVIGQMLNARLLHRMTVHAVTRLAAATLVTTSIVIAAGAQAGLLTALTFGALMVVYGSSFLVVTSNMASLVIDPHREIAGVASSTYGFTSQVMSSVLVFLTVPVFKGSMPLWSLGMVLVTGLVALGVFSWRGGAKSERA